MPARVYPAPHRPSRTAFQRDRERIVQSRAFRRLAGKTQVFTSRASDHFRSRLTHTIEVAQIARAAAATLGLNEDLAETLALVHDIGHPPFGHAGERALDRVPEVAMAGASTTTSTPCASSSTSSSATPRIAGSI